MPRHALISLAALAAVFVGGFSAVATAQQTPQLQAQGHILRPVPPPRRPNRVVGTSETVQGGVRAPRFIVEAVSFTALDESGRDIPLTSDEVIAEFADGVDFNGARHTMMTHEFGDVDTGETRQFPYDESCIVSIPEPTPVHHNTWLCDPHGVAAPLNFRIKLMDGDPPDFGGFCVGGPGTTYGPGSEDLCNADTLMDHAFTYQLSQIMPRIANACRCFTETADWRADSLTHYQIVFRITRVDTVGGPLTVSPNPGPAAQPVLRSGTLTAHNGKAFELDNGVVGDNGDFDFDRNVNRYELDAPGSNGALIWIGGATPRGYAACAAQRGTANYVSSAVQVPADGTYACYVTDAGHIGELHIDSLSTTSQNLTITYTTWQ